MSRCPSSPYRCPALLQIAFLAPRIPWIAGAHDTTSKRLDAAVLARPTQPAPRLRRAAVHGEADPRNGRRLPSNQARGIPAAIAMRTEFLMAEDHGEGALALLLPVMRGHPRCLRARHCRHQGSFGKEVNHLRQILSCIPSPLPVHHLGLAHSALERG